MKRLVLSTAVVAVVLALGFVLWLRSASGGIVDLSDEDVEAARASGKSAETMAVASEDQDAPLPTIADLKLVARRADLDAIAARVREKRDAAVGEARAKLTVLQAEVERLAGNVDEALELAKEGALALPANSRARQVYAGAIFASMMREAADGGMSTLIEQSGSLKRYLAEIDAAIELDPGNLDAVVSRIIPYAYAPWPFGSKKKADALIESIAPHDPLRHHYWKGQMLVIEDAKSDAALEHFVDLDEEYPGDPDVVFQIGALHSLREEWRKAADAFDRLRSEPTNRQGFRALVEGAAARAEGAFELDVALEMLDRFQEERPVGDLMPRMGRVHFVRGRVYEALGRTEKAREAYRAAVEAAPKRERYAEALEALESAGEGSGSGAAESDG